MKSGIHHSEAGVSLVEIMVALFIVGLASGIVMLSVPGPGNKQGEGRRLFTDAVHLARQSAQFSGQPYGFDIDGDELVPVIYSRGSWAPLQDQKKLTLPKGSRIELKEPAPEQSFQLNENDEPLTAEIWCDPSGIVTSVPIVLRVDTRTITVDINHIGEVLFGDE